MDAARSSASVSPYQSLGDLGPRSLGDRPEMELDLWEGQFNLSSLAGPEDEDLGAGEVQGYFLPILSCYVYFISKGLSQEELVEMYSRGATCWGEDSSVTMGTVSIYTYNSMLVSYLVLNQESSRKEYFCMKFLILMICFYNFRSINSKSLCTGDSRR